MKLTKEQLIQNAEAMIAFANGKPIQCSSLAADAWVDMTLTPSWRFHETEYRPKPEPKTRPWNCPDDVPGNCWLRKVGDYWNRLVIMVNAGRVTVIGGCATELQSWAFSQLNDCEYSTDRKTWQPCAVTTEDQNEH